MKKVEKKYNDIYSFIEKYLDKNGFPPTVREICSSTGIGSTATVFAYLERLENDGKITRNFNKNRAIGLTKPHTVEVKSIPLVGTVSAGKGILAVENIEGYYPLPTDIYKGDNLFLLKVQGDSMIEVGISEGDFVVVRQQPNANNDEIVLALFDDNATIKRLKKTNDCILLHPENSTMTDLRFPLNAPPSILGVVIGCIKKF